MPISFIQSLTSVPPDECSWDSAQVLQFSNEVNEDIVNLNRLIKEYNQAHTNKKSALFNNLYVTHRKLRQKYPPILCAQYPGYDTFYNNLFEELQKEGKLYHGKNPLKDSSSTPLAVFFNGLSETKINRLTKIIDTRICKRQLWDATELMYKFPFLSDYDFRLVKGIKKIGNTIVFEVKSKEGKRRESYLLKLEKNRMIGMEQELDLRGKLKSNVLTPIYTSRDAVVLEGNKSTSYTVSLTDYCEPGNLLDVSCHANKIKNKLTAAIETYRQVCEALLEFAEEDLIFSDLRNKNLLLNRQGLLRISDAKSIYRVSNGKLYNPYADVKSYNNRWQELHFSYNPPELCRQTFKNQEYVKANAVNTYNLAINLYQFLTGCDDVVLEKQSRTGLDFTHTVFKDKQGKQLKAIIQKATKADPSKRPFLEELLNKLEKMQSKEQQRCQRLLKHIKDCSMGGGDKIMADFVDANQAKIINYAQNNNLKELRNLERELKGIIRKLVPVTNAVKKSIQSHEHAANCFFKTPGHKAKAAEIAKAMTNLPIKTRMCLTNNKIAHLALDLSYAMGNARFSFGRLFRPKPGAAKTFERFEIEMQKLKPN